MTMIIIHLLPLYFHLTKQLIKKDLSAVYAALDAQDVGFANEAERNAVCMTASVAEEALKPCSIKEERPYELLPATDDKVGNALKSVSNTLDPMAFYDALVNDAAESMMKIFVKARSE